MDNKIIAVDFDGTLCQSKFPDIGRPNENVINYVKERKKNGDKLILWTCRTGERLTDAILWCEKRGIIFDAVNENLPEIIDAMGGDTRKIYADEYLDDKALNVHFQYEEMKMYKYGIYIEQSHGFMNNESDIRFYKMFDIEDIKDTPNQYSQIGKHPDCVQCKNICFGPTGLTFTVYVEKDDNLKMKNLISRLKTILDDGVWDVTVNLTLCDIPDSYQTIRIHKSIA